MAEENEDRLLGLGEVLRLVQLVIDNSRVDGTDYSRVLTDTLERLDLAVKEARGVFEPDRKPLYRSNRIELEVPDGDGRGARLLVDGEDILKRLPVRRLSFRLDRATSRLMLELAPSSIKLVGHARELVVEDTPALIPEEQHGKPEDPKP